MNQNPSPASIFCPRNLAVPRILPSEPTISLNPPIEVEDDVVLRFGMMEGSAKVTATCCVYDPQSAGTPEAFAANGSTSSRLAVVANRSEIFRLSGAADLIDGAKSLLSSWAADVVVVKCGSEGAYVVESGRETVVPAYATEFVWSLGSGDVFAAAFALGWGIQGIAAVEAANKASLATAEYVETMALPLPPIFELDDASRQPVSFNGGRVYLTGPFFDLGQRWVVEEVRRALLEMGLSVFSPVHDIGDGPGYQVAPADIAELKACDVIFALLDGTDSGTLFEVGYARAIDKPVYAIAQRVSEEDLKMVEGSGSKVYSDLCTAIHHMVWRR